MKNYICTAKGFVQGVRFDTDSLKHEILYTDKIRYAQQFKSGAATTFMKRHEIEGFVWKPYKEEPIRNMYVVKRYKHYGVENHEGDVEEWKVEKAIMANESDVKFLRSQKLEKQDMMTFEAAKAKAVELNTTMLIELNEKIKELTNKTEEK